MGTSQSAVARIEQADADIRVSTVERYAAALNRTIHWRISDDAPSQDPEEEP